MAFALTKPGPANVMCMVCLLRAAQWLRLIYINLITLCGSPSINISDICHDPQYAGGLKTFSRRTTTCARWLLHASAKPAAIKASEACFYTEVETTAS